MSRRSPVYRKFAEGSSVMGDINTYNIPLLVSTREEEAEFVENLALCDLTALNRVGLRGRSVASWLQQQFKIELPAINQAVKVQEGLLVIRLSETEFTLLEESEDSLDSFEKFFDKAGDGVRTGDYPDIYYLPRQDSHSCLMVCGKHCATMFSKICAVDLRTHVFSNLSVAQTSLARSNAIIIRRDLQKVPGYFILVDSSLTEYLWGCLLDAMQEFKGGVVGYEVIRSSCR